MGVFFRVLFLAKSVTNPQLCKQWWNVTKYIYIYSCVSVVVCDVSSEKDMLCLSHSEPVAMCGSAILSERVSIGQERERERERERESSKVKVQRRMCRGVSFEGLRLSKP